MVASTHWLASAAGMSVLERGGNAFDAAVAAGFTLQVVEPHLNGPGGEVPAVFWSAERGEPLVLCGQGVAPAAATIERFRALGDMERVLTRIALRSARPRDLSTLRDGLAMLPNLRGVLGTLDSPRLRALHDSLGEHAGEAHLLSTALVEQPPVLARDGGVFADGHDAELAELRRLLRELEVTGV